MKSSGCAMRLMGPNMTSEVLIRMIDHALAKSKMALQTEENPAIMMDLIEIGAALECVKEYLDANS